MCLQNIAGKQAPKYMVVKTDPFHKQRMGLSQHVNKMKLNNFTS